MTPITQATPAKAGKIASPEAAQRNLALAAHFWASPDSSQHDPETVAAAIGYSTSTLQSWRSHGGGPAFCKPPKSSRVFYKKQAVVNWIESPGENP